MRERAWILVHSPLAGPITWQRVADALRRRGDAVVVPELPAAVDLQPPYQPHFERAVREAAAGLEPRGPLYLVAHSGAGPRLPGFAAALTIRCAGHILVDAGVPEDGASSLERMPLPLREQLEGAAVDGLVEPWPEEVLAEEISDPVLRASLAAQLAPWPVALFEERIAVPASWPQAPVGYIKLTAGYPDSEAAAQRARWPAVELPDGRHFEMLLDPEGVAEALIAVAGELGDGRDLPG